MIQPTYGSDKVYPKCVLCRTTPLGGISDGQLVVRRFFCNGCLHDMMDLSPMDEAYDHVLRRLDGFGEAILRRVYQCGAL